MKGTLTGILSADADFERCSHIINDDDRMTCWQNMDRKLMEDVVPWVPYLDATNVDIVGPAVTRYEYDQFSGTAAYSRVAVDRDAQK